MQAFSLAFKYLERQRSDEVFNDRILPYHALPNVDDGEPGHRFGTQEETTILWASMVSLILKPWSVESFIMQNVNPYMNGILNAAILLTPKPQFNILDSTSVSAMQKFESGGKQRIQAYSQFSFWHI